MDENATLQDCFKPIFKYYKQKAVKPCFQNVVDIYNCPLKNVYSKLFDFPATLKSELKNPEQWKMCEYSEIPGLYFLPNPFTEVGINSWVKRCLEDYCKEPHQTNLPLKSNSIWTDTCAILSSTSNENLFSNAGKGSFVYYFFLNKKL